MRRWYTLSLFTSKTRRITLLHEWFLKGRLRSLNKGSGISDKLFGRVCSDWVSSIVLGYCLISCWGITCSLLLKAFLCFCAEFAWSETWISHSTALTNVILLLILLLFVVLTFDFIHQWLFTLLLKLWLCLIWYLKSCDHNAFLNIYLVESYEWLHSIIVNQLIIAGNRCIKI